MSPFTKAMIRDTFIGIFYVGITSLLIFLFMAGMAIIGSNTNTNTDYTSSVEMTSIEEAQKSMFDTSWIEEAWCQGEEFGTIRMIGAWKYADGIVRDEQGCLWAVDIPGVSEEDFLLLWLADNHTSDDTTDDIIIKVWREVH